MIIKIRLKGAGAEMVLVRGVEVWVEGLSFESDNGDVVENGKMVIDYTDGGVETQLFDGDGVECGTSKVELNDLAKIVYDNCESSSSSNSTTAVVYWEGVEQFAVKNKHGKGKAAMDRLFEELDAVIEGFAGEDWDCGDLRNEVVRLGYEVLTSREIGDNWRYDAKESLKGQRYEIADEQFEVLKKSVKVAIEGTDWVVDGNTFARNITYLTGNRIRSCPYMITFVEGKTEILHETGEWIGD